MKFAAVFVFALCLCGKASANVYEGGAVDSDDLIDFAKRYLSSDKSENPFEEDSRYVEEESRYLEEEEGSAGSAGSAGSEGSAGDSAGSFAAEEEEEATPSPTATPTKSPTKTPTNHACSTDSHYCWKSKDTSAKCTPDPGEDSVSYTCECPEDYTQSVAAFVNTASIEDSIAQVCALTSAPTAEPTKQPTAHPCEDGSHWCWHEDAENTAKCTATGEGSYSCECPAGFAQTVAEHVDGKDLGASIRQECEITSAPTKAPTAEPTVEPTKQPTAHPCEDGSHWCWHKDAENKAKCTATGEGSYSCECPAGFAQTVAEHVDGKDLDASIRQECVLEAPTAETPVESTTAAPTEFPTFAPTKAWVVPEPPMFVASDFDANTYTVAVLDSTALATLALPPTDAPTESPTHAGYAIVEKKVEKKVVKVAIAFPVTKDQARNPVMQKSLEAGFAAAIGMEADSVKVATVGGEAVRRLFAGRKLATNEIGFDITSQSNDDAMADTLIDNVKTAVTGGAVVANVQKEASANGVLTAELQTMERALVAPAITKEDVTVIEMVQERVTEPPTKAPTNAPCETGEHMCFKTGQISELKCHGVLPADHTGIFYTCECPGTTFKTVDNVDGGDINSNVNTLCAADGVESAPSPTSNPCGCNSDEFCNFDSGSSGGCEPCSRHSDAKSCDNDGLPGAGAADCKARCHFESTPSAAPTTTPSAAPTSDDMPIILGGVFGGMAVLLACVFILTRGTSSGSAEPTLTPQTSV
jgi:hypothetical protein